MKDFSIQSILADTTAAKDQREKFQPRDVETGDVATDSGVPGKRINSTRLKRHLCVTDNWMTAVDGGSGGNSRKIGDIGAESEQCLLRKLRINFERESFDTTGEEESLATLRDRKCTRTNGEPSEGVTQTRIDLCEVNDAEIAEEYGVKGKVKSSGGSFEDGVRRNENGRNLSEDSMMNGHQRRSSSRKAKASRVTKYEGNSRKSDRDQASCCNEELGGLLENQCERLKDDERSIVQSDRSLPNNLKKNIDNFLEDSTESLHALRSKLEWLHCTRYKPPKVPRKSRTDQHKRKASLHPRIPFSSFQIDVLEKRFRDSAYVSKNDVLDLSTALKLPAKKVRPPFYNLFDLRKENVMQDIMYL